MKKQNFKIKILVAMSGGVDSSVAAALLVKAGYDVAGAFMVNYGEAVGEESCWRGDYQDALRVSAKLGIPLLRMDFTKEYKKLVLDEMYKEYSAGLTPNPDVLCNKFVKFGVWLKKAEELGFDFLATGHYARLLKLKSYKLLETKDKDKDQTYFLHQLSQSQLAKTLFPIGDYTKSEVRALAKRFGLSTAEKQESMGICFVGEVKMKKFLQKKIKVKLGKIILSSGDVVGRHDGVAFYTIGQRMAIEKFKIQKHKSQNTKTFYVVNKNIKRNELVVGFEDDPLLYKKEIFVEKINWIGGLPKFPLKCLVRLRHRQPLQEATVRIETADYRPRQAKCGGVVDHNSLSAVVRFAKPQRAVTPGQFAVFYKNGECLGGGVVKEY